jgi:Na+-transporting methylmalonyl-CoA/oxaloacetate decarboxylase gamma subunit
MKKTVLLVLLVSASFFMGYAVKSFMDIRQPEPKKMELLF